MDGVDAIESVAGGLGVGDADAKRALHSDDEFESVDGVEAEASGIE